MKRYRNLSKKEAAIIEDKHTEPPGTGEFDEFNRAGIFVCKKCDAPLYLSQDKFASGCGWPSFDQEIPGAVTRKADQDGRRTEIICSRCQGHLGHVFLGESLTPKNTRHCVNSLSLSFVPAFNEEGEERVLFAGGCFWGVEAAFEKVKGVIGTRPGYLGGEVAFPTYKEVCTGTTGHVEGVEVVYDPEEVSYEELLKVFLRVYDVRDMGPQYQAAVFYLTEGQKKMAARHIEGLSIELRPATTFYPAEKEHCHYYANH